MARNASGASTQTFALTIDEAPYFTSGTGFTMTENVQSGMNVTVGGFPTGKATETGALPSGVTFEKWPDVAARLFGTPATGTSGDYPITITVTTASGTATQSFDLRVNQRQIPPSA
jgi:hypothetical protein